MYIFIYMYMSIYILSFISVALWLDSIPFDNAADGVGDLKKSGTRMVK